MLAKEIRQEIIALMNREIVPAMGCTEPVAVSLCTAKCFETLGAEPVSINVRLSANILKNAMGVGIPGTGMIGLPIAIALGVIIGKSEYELEVLRDVTPEAVEKGRRLIDSKIINISLKQNITEKLYIEVEMADAAGNTACAVISGGHTNFIHVSRNGEVLFEKKAAASGADSQDDLKLTLRMVYDFAMTTPLDELQFILEARKLNKNIAEISFEGKYGHSVGRTLRCQRQQKLMGDSIFSRILSYTTAACDARMGGSPTAVMSNSGSGNQGIAATLPVVIYAEESGATEEQTIRALALSHLTVIYIKQSLGRLSALCGCVVATTGSACGLCYLMGGDFDQISATVKNMVANLTGMICDGAKPSCAMKLYSDVSTAMISAMMALEGNSVTAVEGIIDNDVDKTIHNLTYIGREGMNETDRLILEIMTSKE